MLERADRRAAVAALRAGLDRGATHIDTAEIYGDGAAEEIVGEAIAGRRDEVFLVSKVLPSNASRAGTIAACERSLARLRTDRLDCYLLHWRGRHPLAETIAAFERLARDGKIRSSGVSNVDVDDLEEALAIAGPGRIACDQVLYHLEERAVEHAVIPWCEAHGVAVVGYSPFGHDAFPGPRTAGGRALAEVAAARGATPRQVALRLLARRAGAFAIPKASRAAHAAENAAAGDLTLAEADLARIEAAFPRGPRPRALPVLCRPHAPPPCRSIQGQPEEAPMRQRALGSLVALTVTVAVMVAACGGGGGGGSPAAGGGAPTGGSTGGTTGGTTGGLPSGTQAPFVPAPPAGAATRFVSPSGADTNDGLTPQTAWRTLQRAADAATAGTIVEVADGSYARFTLEDKHGTAQAPIVFRATGTGAVIDHGTSSSTSPDLRDAIKIVSSSHVIVHGLRTRDAFRAGVRISESLHVTIQAGVFEDGGKWGIFTDYSDDVKLLGNECMGSADEHGIYHSNSGDREVIAGNYCHDNDASGIQINADPRQTNPSLGTRGDGISEGCIVERNLCVRNGAAGGAALNFASLRGAIVRNNLLVENFSQSGIVLWDDGNDPSWGSKDNVIENNTVAFASGVGRFCLALHNGSTGNVVRGNVFRGGARGAVSFTSDSLAGLVDEGNVVHSVDGWDLFVNDATDADYDLAGWRALTGTAATTVAAAPVFAADWSLQAGSPGRDALPRYAVSSYEGTARPTDGTADAGCFER